MRTASAVVGLCLALTLIEPSHAQGRLPDIQETNADTLFSALGEVYPWMDRHRDCTGGWGCRESYRLFSRPLPDPHFPICVREVLVFPITPERSEHRTQQPPSSEELITPYRERWFTLPVQNTPGSQPPLLEEVAALCAALPHTSFWGRVDEAEPMAMSGLWEASGIAEALAAGLAAYGQVSLAEYRAVAHPDVVAGIIQRRSRPGHIVASACREQTPPELPLHAFCWEFQVSYNPREAGLQIALTFLATYAFPSDYPRSPPQLTVFQVETPVPISVSY